MHFGRTAELRSGLWWGRVEAEPSTGDSSLPESNVSRAAVRLVGTIDTVDDLNFPRRGFYSRASGWLEKKALGADDSYDKYTLDTFWPLSSGPHTVTPRISGGINPGDDMPFYDQFTLGGPGSMSGYRSDELRGGEFFLGRLLYAYELERQMFSFASASYLGFALDWGNVWQKTSDMSFGDLVFGGTAYAAVDTAFGPLYVGCGMNDDLEKPVFFFSFGQRI